MKKYKIFILAILLIPMLAISQNEEIVFPVKHSLTLTSLKYSPDKQYIVTSSNDWTLKLWYASSGSLMRTFSGHTGAVNCFDFSINGKYLVSGSNDSSVIIWDLTTTTKFNEFQNLGGKVTSIAFNHNNENIIIGTNNGKLSVVNINTGKIEYNYSFSKNKITQVGFTKEKNKLLVSTSNQTSGSDNTIDQNSAGSLFLFDLDNFNKPIAISNYKENVINFCFSADSEKVVTSAGNGMVRVWKTKSYMEEIAFKNINLNPGVVFISGNGKMIGVASQNESTINLWRISGEKLFDFQLEKGKAIYGEFNTDFTRIHICNDFGSFLIYDLDARSRDEMGQYLQTESSLTAFALSKTSNMMALGFGNGLLKGFNLSTCLPYKLTLSQNSKVIDLAFSADEKRLCTSNDQTVIYYENIDKTEAGNAIETFLETSTGTIKSIFAFKTEYVTSILTYGNYCLSGLNSGTIKLHDVNSGKELNVSAFHDYDITDISISSDNKCVVTSSTDATIKVWKVDATKFTQTNTFSFNNEITNIKSALNNQLIIASEKGSGLIFINDLKKENQYTISEKSDITDIDISEKDSLVYSSYNSNKTLCKAYSFVTHNEVWNFNDIGSKIIKLSYSDKNNLLFCALENGLIIILNAKTGKKIATILIYKNNEWLIFTPENYFDASAGLLPKINIINKLQFINHDEIEKFHQKGILAKILMQ